jgi:predicted house-cleaning noncanonical NTP pyrophosphatase (MazG superfamily)
VKLKEKLQEEVDEFMKKADEEELADILEVIDAICEYKKSNKESVLKIEKKKMEIRSGFKEKTILEES